MGEAIDTQEIMQTWRYETALTKKPKLEEACNVIANLCLALNDARQQLSDEKKRQDFNDQRIKDMFVELENVVSKHRHGYE